MDSPTSFRLGLEVALSEPPPILSSARRIGLLLNQASVDAGFKMAHERFAERFPGRLAALFGPQHGLWSEQQDNMIETPHATDPALALPCHSLYSERREPTAAMLNRLDLFVVDLQDVGTRIYTYIWTMLLAMRACARAGVPVLVLDRPNPLGGEVIEGPLLRPAFASFVGLLPIPMRHGLTIGELARWFHRHEGLDLDLQVVSMHGYARAMLWSDLGRGWVPTSPNLPSFEGVLVYPGQVLLEGTSLSEGRGTTTPFQTCGAPWLDGFALRETMIALGGMDHLVARPLRFEPTFQKHVGRSCGGVFLHVLDPARARSYRATLSLLAAARALAPKDFGWRPPPYEYELDKMPIDILAGGDELRVTIDRGATAADLDRLAAVDAGSWWREVDASLLYPRNH